MIVTRKQALEQNLTQYYTGKPCRRGHLSARNTSSSNCLECWREDATKTRRANPDAFKALKQAEYERNKESILAGQKRYREANWDQIYTKRKADPNYREYMNRYFRKYMKQPIQKAKQLARVRMRQAIKLQQTPDWAKTDNAKRAMEQLYIKAQQLTMDTGVPHEVDHIIPLKNDLVCGLHCPENLQILTRQKNRTKWNYHRID